ncbi:MAG: DJ-1/PfpI family protein [Oscillospiraceae bacterium]|nr:DJ-1/PfpI family protein [Oscillospiraceae bacterium]
MKNVCIFLANGFEEIEAVTAADMLRRASIGVNIVSLTGNIQVAGKNRILLTADILHEDADYSAVDMLILPGGMPGTENLMKSSALTELIRSFNQTGRYIAAICAAPIVLGKAGILKGVKAACYPGFEDQLGGAVPSTERCVVSGNIITSRGPGTALEFALTLITLLAGKEKSDTLSKTVLA